MTDGVEAGVARLAAAVEGQVAKALAALSTADLGAADEVVRADGDINRDRYAIEQTVTDELLAGSVDVTRMRTLLSTIHVVGDLERIGDHAEGIAKVALMLGRPPIVEVPASLEELGEQVRVMLHDGITAFAQRDTEAARQICAHDDVIDGRYDAVCGEQLSLMAGRVGDVAVRTYLLWVAHNLERIADRVTNVCERTVYLVTGNVEELNVSNY